MTEKNITALKNLSALVDFGKQINSNLDLNFTIDNLLFTLFGKLMINKGAALLTDENDKLYLARAKGIKISDDKLKNLLPREGYELKRFSDATGLKHSFELSSEDKTIGFILLGDKLTNEEYTKGDFDFVKTIANIASAAINNAKALKRLSETNRELDSKINQLNSLFDLAKEFTGLFDSKLIGRTFIYTLLGQFMASRYAIISCGNGLQIIDSNFDVSEIEKFCRLIGKIKITRPRKKQELIREGFDIANTEIELIVPMQIKNETKGLVLLGKAYQGREYSKSDVEFIYSAASLAVISLENSRLFEEFLQKQKIEKDLEVARTIQQNLLPSKFPKFNNFEIEAANIPARQVGGDYFDILKLDEDRTLIVIADVSGKGMQAALLMANIQAFIKTLSKLDYPPDKATNMLNNLVSENTTNGSFITMFWGILNDKTLEFEFVNAGHNPPLLLRYGEIKKLKRGGLILGVMETLIPYESEKIQLQPDDILFLFTDGISEAMDKNYTEFGEDKIEEIISQSAHLSPGEIKEKILDELARFTDGAIQSDDITMLVVKVLNHKCEVDF